MKTEPSTRMRVGLQAERPATALQGASELQRARRLGLLGGVLLTVLALLLSAGPELSVLAASAEPQAQAETQTEAPLTERAPTRERFFDRVDVNVVNVEVYVTDEEGHPVTGLTRDDFELFVDGEPVEISNFYAIEAGDPAPWERPVRSTGAESTAAASGEGDGTEAAPETVIAPSPAPPPEERRLHLVVYVDQLNITPSSRNRVLEGLELFLEERLTAGDRVMVVSSHPAFRVVQGFTEDRQKVLDAVRDVQKRSASSLFMERRVILNQLSRAADAGDDPLALEALRSTTLSSIRQYALQASQEIGMEIEKLRGLVGSFAGLPGRKAVLHVSDGIPSRPGEDLFALWEIVFAPSGEGLAGDYRGRLVETANDDLAPRIQKLVRDANARSVTFYTLEAGGRDDAGITAEVRGMTSTGNRFGGTEVAALLLGRWRNPMRAYLEVGEPQRKSKNRYEVPVTVKIPLDRVTLLPGPGSHRGLLRVRVAFQGNEGTGFGVGEELKVPIEIPDGRLEAARAQHFTVSVSLELDPGLHRIAVGVWDEVAAEASYLPYDVVVEKG